MKFAAILLAAVCLQAAPAAAGDAQVERGRALATIGDCVACHTAPGGVPFAGGRAVETPFGNVVAPNITADRETGLGAWTDAEYLRAMQSGIGRHGEHLYPAFPYPYFSRVPTADLRAIRAYLATIPPVRNHVRRNLLPFPFDIRLGMAAWNSLYFAPTPLGTDPAKSAEWNRGAALVEGLGHCAACHTPKTTLGGDEASQPLHGGNIQNWFAPALNADPRTGLGAWSTDDVVDYLHTGRNARAAASGPMAEVVTFSTSKMTPQDLRAIAVYLKDQPAPAATPEPAPTSQAGAAIYADVCAACHTTSGEGIPRLFPPLKASASVQSSDPTSVLRVILVGTRAAATSAAPTGPAMPGFAWKLTDPEIAALATYIRNTWGNAASAVDPAAVTTARHRLIRGSAE